MADEAVPFCVEVYLYFLSFSHSKHLLLRLSINGGFFYLSALGFLKAALERSSCSHSIIIDGHSNYRGKLSFKTGHSLRSVATHGRKSGHLVTPYAFEYSFEARLIMILLSPITF